jgi:hypothetical protein
MMRDSNIDKQANPIFGIEHVKVYVHLTITHPWAISSHAYGVNKGATFVQ